MKKYLLFAFAIIFVAACHENPVNTPTLNNTVVPEFHQLTIDFGEAVSPVWVNQVIVVNSKPEIIKTVTEGAWATETEPEREETVCMGVVPLKQDEYEAILQLVKAVNLGEYAPSGDCEPLIGGTGYTVSYMTTLGTTNEFHIMCELDPELGELINEVDRMADELITDCDTGMASVSTVPAE